MDVIQHYTFSNDREAWRSLSESIKALLISQQIEMHYINTVLLCVDELVSNILKYAFLEEKVAAAHKIEMTVKITCDRIQVTLVDDGVPFDLTQIPKVKTDTILDEIKVGGLGILLVTSLMDEVLYSRVDHHNMVTISKFHEVSNAT